jgi:hypothetical protein
MKEARRIDLIFACGFALTCDFTLARIRAASGGVIPFRSFL